MIKKIIKNFGEIPKKYSTFDNAKIVLLPIPYDGTSTWIKGADKGPQAIIDSSVNLELYDIETKTEIYKKGIYIAEPVKIFSNPELIVKESKKVVAKYLKKEKIVVALGGEHTVSVGVIEAYKEKYPDLNVLQLDAHADLRQEYLGSKFNHACVMARVKEICPIVQVGIRSMDISEKKDINKERVFFAEDIYNKTNWQEKAISKLAGKIYITIDLDVFDPSIMPSTGTPEPGGLGWYQVLNFLKKVCAKREVVGFDIVELCPNKFDKSSDYLAAKLIYKLLGYIALGSRSCLTPNT